MEIAMPLPNLPVRMHLDASRSQADVVLLPVDVLVSGFDVAMLAERGLRELEADAIKLRLVFRLWPDGPRHGLELALELRTRVIEAFAAAEARLVTRRGGPFRETVSTDAVESARERWREETRRT